MRTPLAMLVLLLAAGSAGCQFSPFRSIGATPPSAIPGRGDVSGIAEAVTDREAADGLFVGLALSGGGSRAAVFSGEVLLRLAELGVTDRVDYISAVSGGALAAATYCLSRDPGDPAATEPGVEDFVWNDAFVDSALTRNFVAHYQLRQLSPVDFVRYWFTGYNRSGRVADTFDDVLFGGRTFGDLNPKRPKLLINTTRLNDGRRFTFTDEALAELNIRADRLRVADAVGASSAVPGLFHARAFPRYRPDGAGGWETAGYVHLSDGVARDNLGVEALMAVYLANRAKFPKGAVILIADATRPDVSPPHIGDKPDLRRGLDYVYDSKSAGVAAGVLLEIIREDTLWHLAAAGRDQPIRVVRFSYTDGLPGAGGTAEAPKTPLEGPGETLVRLRTPFESNGRLDLLVPTDLRITREQAESVRRTARTVVDRNLCDLRDAGLLRGR